MIILIIGYFVAKAIAKIVGAVLERVGFDQCRRARRREEGAGPARSTTPATSSARSSSTRCSSSCCTMAFGVFGTNPISDLLEGVIAYLPKVIAAILIIVIASAIGAAARELIDASLGELSYGKALANGVGVAILVVGIFAALNQLQIAPAIVDRPVLRRAGNRRRRRR
ncbi:MAG: hypothetical protein WKF58_19705 [Ilumatobacteraceae bacterium]